ncbi:MAG: hypothetical protein OSA99_20295 [Acidimicrobiales bacterium]|nr:hypothetical protein [Acidimicrobiales bacterium]
MQRIGVVSGRFPSTRFESPTNHKAYCDLHGYTYIHCNWPTGARNPYMNKLRYLLSYFDLFDYIFWIDDDAFFLDTERSLDHALPTEDAFLSICASPTNKSLKTFISSGQFALRCDERARSFLIETEAMDLDAVRDWWTPELGFFTNGDQDAMTYLLKTTFTGQFDLHPHDHFNSRTVDVLDGQWDDVFVVHFTGAPAVKEQDWRAVQAWMGRPASLLPRPLHDQYHGDPQSRARRRITPRFVGRAIRSRLARAWQRLRGR